jgi:hypothetical protein
MENALSTTSETSRTHIVFAVLSTISVLIFWKSLAALTTYSFDRESASHILLIPLIAIYLLYNERKRIFQHHDGGFVFFLLASAILAPALFLQKSERTSQSLKPIIPAESGVAPSA